MIKKVILEIIQKRVKPIDDTNQFGLQYINSVADIYWQKFAFNYMNNFGLDSFFYSKMYVIPNILTEPYQDGDYYVELPEKVIRMPYGAYSNGAEGVLSVYPVDIAEWPIKPIREHEYRMIKNLPVYLTASEHYYWVSKDRVYFSDNLTVDIVSDGVRMNLAIPFSAYSLTEDIPLPSDMEQPFIEAVIAFIQGTPPPDLKNDNSDI